MHITLTAGSDASLPRVDLERLLVDPSLEWDALSFWSAYAPWLESRGYTLYSIQDSGLSEYPYFVPRVVSSTKPLHPYASFELDVGRPFDGTTTTRRLAMAQDKNLNDLFIKLVKNESQELAVYERLRRCPELFKASGFPGVLPPVDIVPSPHDFSFVIMPRWGAHPEDTAYPSNHFVTTRELLDFFTSIVEGLSFLHSLRIAHMDPRANNMLINHYDHNKYGGLSVDIIRKHRASPDLRYCLFDFDHSLIYPELSCLSKCRIPGEFQSPDCDLGQPYFSGFAYDVAALGAYFSRFNYAIPSCPLLAPLLERMCTEDPSRRFSASDSLNFCRYIRRSLSLEELESLLPTQDPSSGPIITDRWDGLSEQFTREWSSYRDPSPSWSMAFLLWLGRRQWGWTFLNVVRRVLRI